jgi:ABC-2 type transport system ATP-binding protein
MYGLGGASLKRRVDEVLDLIGLADRQRDAVGTFSGGMKRRVNIGVALLHHPKVVIMDEPTVGIDPQSRRHILDSVKALNRQGMTVLYTTHYMEEAEELSSRIAIVDAGRVVALGTRDELVRLVGESTRVEVDVVGEVERAIDVWRSLAGVGQVSRVNGDGRVCLLTPAGDALLPRLFESAGRAGVHIGAVDVREPNLEAVFLHLTGRALRN